MPHLRARFLEPLLRKDLTWSPVVSVLGMRQVGKTTLLKSLGKSYLSLDDESLRSKWEAGDWSLLESSRKPVVVDEAQKVPGVFERVKLTVDRERRPGQYLLTGSVRFLSRKEIRESLTGRTSILELLPLTLREAHGQDASAFLENLTQLTPEKFLQLDRRGAIINPPMVDHYLLHGGMPGICFKRDAQVRRQMRDAHLETLLLRDLQLLVRTKVPYEKLRALLQKLAQLQGQPISMTQLGRQVQISTPTVIQLVRAFADLFIIKPHGKSFYFTDCGMASYLGADRVEDPLFQMERWIYTELRSQLQYQHRSSYELSQFATRGGARVPFVVEIEGRRPVAIVVDPTPGASEKSLKSLNVFKKQRRKPFYPVVLHAGSTASIASTGALALPYTWIG